jgi:hypothetical protein
VANDGAMNSNVASISIDVQGNIPNVSPISTIDDDAALGTPCIIPIYPDASNVDRSLFEIITQPANASVVANLAPNSAITLTVTARSAGVVSAGGPFGVDS